MYVMKYTLLSHVGVATIMIVRVAPKMHAPGVEAAGPPCKSGKCQTKSRKGHQRSEKYDFDVCWIVQAI